MCKEVNEEIKKAKEESWRELLEEVVTDADEQKLWRIIKSLNGCPASNARNEAISHGKNSVITSMRSSFSTMLKLVGINFPRRRDAPIGS